MEAKKSNNSKYNLVTFVLDTKTIISISIENFSQHMEPSAVTYNT